MVVMQENMQKISTIFAVYFVKYYPALPFNFVHKTMQSLACKMYTHIFLFSFLCLFALFFVGINSSNVL